MNGWIHEGGFSHPNALVLGARQKLEDFHLANQKDVEEPGQKTLSRWNKPVAGWLKLNCDAAMDLAGKRMGKGIIVRDHYGQVKAAWNFTNEGLFEPAAAEAMALFHGLNFCKALLIENLIDR